MDEPKSAFHVIGFEDADAMLMKAELARAIRDILAERGVRTQREAAELMGLSQSDVSLLLRGVVRRFTVERIMQALQRLDNTARVSLVIEHGPRPEPVMA